MKSFLPRIDEEEKNLIDFRFAHQLKQLTNTAKIGLIKKDIAKMKTDLKRKRTGCRKKIC
jgi:large subunit ribosomal protein L29